MVAGLGGAARCQCRRGPPRVGGPSRAHGRTSVPVEEGRPGHARTPFKQRRCCCSGRFTDGAHATPVLVAHDQALNQLLVGAPANAAGASPPDGSDSAWGGRRMCTSRRCSSSAQDLGSTARRHVLSVHCVRLTANTAYTVTRPVLSAGRTGERDGAVRAPTERGASRLVRR